MMNPSSFASKALEKNLENNKLDLNEVDEYVDLNELDKPILSQELHFSDDVSGADLAFENNNEIHETDSLDSPILAMSDDGTDVNKLDDNANRFEGTHLPRNNGEWEGGPGDSDWKPDGEYIPQSKNPEGKTWSEILEEYDIESIPFKDGYPDFSEVAEETVEIDDFTENRDLNFAQADKATAEKWNEEGKDGRSDWKASEVKQYRKDNDLTWHECEDTKTLQLVPSEVHNNVPHSGGISEKKQQS
ncbi:HNH endonuclease [Vibrio diabolicus]|uniref:HNH endonuclease n=1 Tax=Vibrio diabolicus TaxID=50719 RepID=UPI00249411DB|nr:HNH endonuclease [Vibrio diabolicus]